MRARLAAAAAALLLAGCASTKVVAIRPAPDDPAQEVVVTRTCRATGPMQEDGVYSFQLTRMASSLKQWPMMILTVPLDLVFLPLKAVLDVCCHTCTDTEAARPKGTAL